MRFLLAALSLVLLISFSLADKSNAFAEIEENEFAEFDFEDEGDEFSQPKDDEDDSFVETVNEDDAEDALVEEDTGNEFSHLTDPDEFENFSDKSEDSEEFTNEKPVKKSKEPSAHPAVRQYSHSSALKLGQLLPRNSHDYRYCCLLPELLYW